MKKKILKNVTLYGLLVLILLIIDQLSKHFVRRLPLGEKASVIPGFFWITHAENTGASFSMLQGQNGLLIWISVIALGLLIYYYEEFKTRIEKIFFALLLTGIIGNLIDRVFFGSVTDMFDLGWWPVFNVADSCLSVGVAGLIVYELYKKYVCHS